MRMDLIHEIPKVGFIALRDKEPVASAFLRRLEYNYGMIDGLITNPNSLPEYRHFAIDALIDKIKEKAIDLGIRRLIAFSVDKSTLARSSRLGFVQLPDTLIALDL